MPLVRVVLPAALSPAIASMTGRCASRWSWRDSRMSLSGMVVILASPRVSGDAPGVVGEPSTVGAGRGRAHPPGGEVHGWAWCVASPDSAVYGAYDRYKRADGSCGES